MPVWQLALFALAAVTVTCAPPVVLVVACTALWRRRGTARGGK